MNEPGKADGIFVEIYLICGQQIMRAVAAMRRFVQENKQEKEFAYMGCFSYKSTNTCAVPLVLARREDAHNGRIFYCLDGRADGGSF